MKDKELEKNKDQTLNEIFNDFFIMLSRSKDDMILMKEYLKKNNSNISPPDFSYICNNITKVADPNLYNLLDTLKKLYVLQLDFFLKENKDNLRLTKDETDKCMNFYNNYFTFFFLKEFIEALQNNEIDYTQFKEILLSMITDENSAKITKPLDDFCKYISGFKINPEVSRAEILTMIDGKEYIYSFSYKNIEGTIDSKHLSYTFSLNDTMQQIIMDIGNMNQLLTCRADTRFLEEDQPQPAGHADQPLPFIIHSQIGSPDIQEPRVLQQYTSRVNSSRTEEANNPSYTR
jgi:hypothetical protein